MATRWQVTKAVRASDLPSPSRLIMLVLADVAEVGTAEIPEKFTPSVTVLEHETGLSRSTVQRHLASLEKEGWIARTRPATAEAMWSGERIRYHLSVPGQVSEEDQGGVTEIPGVVSERPEGGVTETPLETDHSDQDQIPSLPRKRGTRIPADFHVTAHMRAWALTNVPELAGSRETEKFINYWRARTKDATKLDWEATWRNWMLNAAERVGARASPKSSAPVAIPKIRQCPEHPDQQADDCRHCDVARRAKRRTE